MIFSSNKIIKIIKKNIEITFLFLLLLITISSTAIYNEKKALIDENYKNLINNIYFQKSINQIFDNLVPRYKNIDHKISSGETFDKILNNYSINHFFVSIFYRKYTLKKPFVYAFRRFIYNKFTLNRSHLGF